MTDRMTGANLRTRANRELAGIVTAFARADLRPVAEKIGLWQRFADLRWELEQDLQAIAAAYDAYLTPRELRGERTPDFLLRMNVMCENRAHAKDIAREMARTLGLREDDVEMAIVTLLLSAELDATAMLHRIMNLRRKYEEQVRVADLRYQLARDALYTAVGKELGPGVEWRPAGLLPEDIV